MRMAPSQGKLFDRRFPEGREGRKEEASILFPFLRRNGLRFGRLLRRPGFPPKQIVVRSWLRLNCVQSLEGNIAIAVNTITFRFGT